MSVSWAETAAGSASSTAKKTLRVSTRRAAFTGKEKIERRKLTSYLSASNEMNV
jgi:hypothetical protein